MARALLNILAALMISSTGCTVMSLGRDAITKTSRMFIPNSRDYDDGSDDSGKEWEFVGDEGRGDQEREKDPDPWFRQYLMSEKARSIEHNLGID
jgi:hypothetical protein